MSEFGIASESSSESRVAGVPEAKLSIEHLMLMTLCCATYWALMNAINSRSTLHMERGLTHGIIAGAVFTGVITLVSRRIRKGTPLLEHPGHWLLMIGAIATLIEIPVIYVVADSLSMETKELDRFCWQYLALVAMQLVPGIVFAVAACGTRAPVWKVLFIAITLLDATMLLYFFDMEFFSVIHRTWAKILLAVAMVVVSVVELKIGLRRDWMHWTGVMAHFASRIFLLC